MLPSKRKMKALTAAELRTLLHYNPTTGVFTWLARPSNPEWSTKFAGKAAGGIAPNGYRNIQVNGESHGAHRLAWLYMTGRWPANEIDHVDRDPVNNVWSNLREATGSQNCINRAYSKGNTSGQTGVSWNTKKQQWKAGIHVAGKSVFLGYFDDVNAAIAARKTAERTHFGQYARL